jgi:uncharacterized integral membrane protein
MDALIQTVSQTVSHDVLELMHATHAETSSLIEMQPPNWRWGVPLGFASLAAAGALLVAAAGVQESMKEQQHHHARRHNTKMHQKKLVATHAPLQS